MAAKRPVKMEKDIRSTQKSNDTYAENADLDFQTKKIARTHERRTEKFGSGM